MRREVSLWEDRCKLKEAKVVVSPFKEILENRESGETVGIVTFNRAQQDAIYEMLESEVMKEI